MKHLPMALCCVGVIAVLSALAALGIIAAPLAFMAVVCPAAIGVMLWLHSRHDISTEDRGGRHR